MHTQSSHPLLKSFSQQSEKFFSFLTNPSPLGWIFISGFAFVLSRVINVQPLQVLFLLLFLLTVFRLLENSVKHLKQLYVNQPPNWEYRFWQHWSIRLSNTTQGFEWCSKIWIGSVFAQIILSLMAFTPAQLFVVSLVVSVILTIGQFARVLTLWSLKP